MFYYLNGEVTLMEGNLAVIDCGGVGYACHTTAYTLSKLRVGPSRPARFPRWARPASRCLPASSCVRTP